MKKAFSLAASLVVVLCVLWSCGGGGGGGTPADTNVTTNATGTTTNSTNTSGTLAGGCAGYTNTSFNGSCEDYYGISAATYESGCRSDATSVWYAGGCPTTIGSSTRLGACTVGGGTSGQFYVFVSYSPENTIEDAKTMCSYLGGTWGN